MENKGDYPYLRHQITFFLSTHDVIRDSADGAKETVLVWQVSFERFYQKKTKRVKPIGI